MLRASLDAAAFRSGFLARQPEPALSLPKGAGMTLLADGPETLGG
jgi:hypothetical protein